MPNAEASNLTCLIIGGVDCTHLFRDTEDSMPTDDVPDRQVTLTIPQPTPRFTGATKAPYRPKKRTGKPGRKGAGVSR